MSVQARRRAVFLDRDGVLNEEVDYLDHPDRLKLLPGAAAAVKRLREAGYKAVVVSNQSGVARGYFTKKTLAAITRRLASELGKRGARLDAIYYCVHHPDAGRRIRCRCRKPGTLLLERAARRFKLDLSRSFFIGDTTTDVLTAKRAGCVAVLVRTGKAGKDGVYSVKPDKTVKDLRAAAEWILRR